MAGANHLRLLYHFTSESNLRAIVDSGQIVVSGGPTGHEAAASSVRVVWLTDDADPGSGNDHGLGHPADQDPELDKRAVRFTVAVSDAQHWAEWARRRRVTRRALRRIDDAGGGLSERWWVVPRAIASSEWTFVENLRTGELIWPLADTRGRVPALT
jgi:hypothetical protein